MLTTTLDDGIAVITIDLPGRSMNVMDAPLIAALDAEVARLASLDAVTGIVITSGKSAFIAGADLAMLGVLTGTPREIAAKIGEMGDAFRRIERCGKPVVAAATGTALGAGLELMLSCHYRIAADTKGAIFGLPEVKLGLFPGLGGTQRLPRIVGIEAALPLMLEGRPLSPAEALKAGLIHELVPADDLLLAAIRALKEGRVAAEAPWDRKGFALPGGAPSTSRLMDAFSLANGRALSASKHNYPAPEAILTCVFEGTRLPIDKALRLEAKHFGVVFAGPVPRAMIRTLFFAKQAADKLARRPAGIAPRKVGTVGIIGAGFMGRGIAEVSALAGMDVVLLDVDSSAAEAARATILATLDGAVEKKRLSAEKRDAAAARLTAGTDYALLGACDLVIEAVFEDRDLKARIIQAAEAAMRPGAVFATNTSSLPISGLAAASGRPDNLVGLHFFSPVPRMALVEVIRGAATSDETLALALDYVGQIRKTPIVVNDGFGFYTTRCVDAFIREGLRLLAEGTPPAVIDNAAVAVGMPVGPITLADEIGLDVMHHIKQEARIAYGEAYVADASDALYDTMKAQGRFGRKTKAGFFDYGPEGKRLWAGTAALAQEARPSSAQDAGERLLAIQAVTAAGAFAEGIVTDPAEADLGAVLGWAFPSYLGGPFGLMDKDGLPAFVVVADRLVAAHGNRFRLPPVVREMAERGEGFFAPATAAAAA
ncbi:3-hydroxyacyl-CoA dehydrogenase NAD-binding domain-containing protein [Aquabacter cavernae]|uniref:3-hydroxyacyl-CoA dehydrogenase NAD-binding domain-containing protein n=1 Tax=Aquabacter cavernae TaxID=2496029 RepID=UPI000F8F63D8|nr:3-hydroxyacyl-CoA dehydrogenase NAD-binding domain-containing protein [Aquabacter cavernae]